MIHCLQQKSKCFSRETNTNSHLSAARKAALQTITEERQYDMLKVLKFGGSSMADDHQFAKVQAIVDG